MQEVRLMVGRMRLCKLWNADEDAALWHTGPRNEALPYPGITSWTSFRFHGSISHRTAYDCGAAHPGQHVSRAL